MKKNNRGFTLIELLVTVIIMLIILLVVIPSIMKIKQNNQTKSYEFYGDSMIAAAKLYTNKEGEDISQYGNDDWSGCIEFSLQDLIDNDLLKAYKEGDIDCSVGAIRLYREAGKTSPTYDYRLVCIDKTTSEEVYKKQFNDPASCRELAPLSNKLAERLINDSANNINTDDPEQTFITGESPKNYIWYSGKLWRAVSIDPSDNSVKLVTQWDISSVTYNASGSSVFDGSHMEQWLNDTSVSGFLGNLREPDKFIKMNSQWNATESADTTKPANTTMVEDAIGLLNIYEYTMSYNGTTAANGYLNNGLYWLTLTPSSASNLHYIYSNGSIQNIVSQITSGVRPSVNLKSSVKIIEGSGTETDPYRLEGDNDTPTSGTLLNTRYSGEYIRFGSGENNLYRIISKENGSGVKIVSAEPLSSGMLGMPFDSDSNMIYSDSTTLGSYLNNDYLTISNGYLTSDQINMIEDMSTWTIHSTGATTTAKIGLLRTEEQLAGQFAKSSKSTNYWTLTITSTYDSIEYVSYVGEVYPESTLDRSSYGVRPAMNLKSAVYITGGTGTKQDPFKISLKPFTVGKATITGGSISLSDTSVIPGTTVSFTSSPSSGFSYYGATIKDSNGNTLQILDSSTTSFMMPAENITISPKWKYNDLTVLHGPGSISLTTWSGGKSTPSNISFTSTTTTGFLQYGATSTNWAYYETYSDTMYNLTHYQKLQVSAYNGTGEMSTGPYYIIAGVSVDKTSYYVYEKNATQMAVPVDTFVTLELDFSTIGSPTGNHYIGIAFQNNYQVFSGYVYVVNLIGKVYE